MGNRYYASVMFPPEAMNVPEIAKEARAGYYDLQADAHEVSVADSDANYGQMDSITLLLDQHRVPYDHCHQGGSDERYTVYVRFDECGNKVTVAKDEADEAVEAFAQRCLKMLTENGVFALRGLLKEAINEVSDLKWTQYETDQSL